MPQTEIPHWIDGSPAVRPSDHRAIAIDNPATGQVTATVQPAGPNVVDEAVRSANHAAAAWGQLSVPKRLQPIFNFRNLLAARATELAEIVTREHGKTTDDALGEIARGLEVVEFACGIGELLKGEVSGNVSTDVDVHSMRHPIGTSAIISPFNFPAMVPMWFFPVSIACGNTVILKPSEKAPSAANWMADLWKEAGLPPGVFNVIHGGKESVDELLIHPGVDSISFVGSTPVARYIYETSAANGKRVQALGGAKNHMLVLPDADLGVAANAAVSSAFGSAGERCMAISVVLAAEAIADELVERICTEASKINVGDGRSQSDMGPLITKEHRDRVHSYIDGGERQGATVCLDGRKISDINGVAEGYWLRPTVFDRVDPDMDIYRDEVFGPVLCVARVPDFESGLNLINESPYGNGTAIFTRDGVAARRFTQRAQVGMVGVNVPIPVPVAYHSFGGWKDSLFGDLHAYGPDGVQFFTRGKVVTARWSAGGDTDLGMNFPGSD